MFKGIIRIHTEMILNPFYEFSNKISDEDQEDEDDEDNASNFNNEGQFNSQINNKECLFLMKCKLDEIVKYFESQL